MSETGARVLVVDDEPAIRRFLRVSLSAHGYAVFEADSGQAALSAVTSDRPDLIILDLGLPDIDGIEITRLLREWTHIPTIILSVRGQEADKIAALDAGADDYLIKPFGMGELLARMRVALRRASQCGAQPVFTSGDLTVDLARRVVAMAGQEVQLTPTEYDLLRALVTHAGKVLTHRQLLREVWGHNVGEQSQYLRVYVNRLRKKLRSLAPQAALIQTDPGIGYRLI